MNGDNVTDPATEAAQRAWPKLDHDESSTDLLEMGAREALAPIRELHRPYVTNDPRSPHDVVCNHCLGPVKWPCTTAIYAYSTEELQ